eukprot:4533420-Amphidinium_carterae.1
MGSFSVLSQTSTHPDASEEDRMYMRIEPVLSAFGMGCLDVLALVLDFVSAGLALLVQGVALLQLCVLNMLAVKICSQGVARDRSAGA